VFESTAAHINSTALRKANQRRAYHSARIDRVKRELVSDNRLTRKKWPLLYWINWVSLGACVASLAGFVVTIAYQSSSRLSPEALSNSNGIAGLAVLGFGSFGILFLVTGYIRLFKAHRLPGRVSRTRPARSTPLLARALGGLVFVSAVLAGWVHWDVETAIVFAVVGVVIYLAVRWR
jgi:hypothetical protein